MRLKLSEVPLRVILRPFVPLYVAADERLSNDQKNQLTDLLGYWVYLNRRLELEIRVHEHAGPNFHLFNQTIGVPHGESDR